MNDYKIFILGASGSGKTVFLASLFKAFSTQGKFGFSLSIDDTSKRKKLNKIYKELIAPESWPRGTQNHELWTFNCYIKNSSLSSVKACTLTYFDYAGGLITDESIETDDSSSQFESSIETADAVLILLDGQKLISLMQDQDSKISSDFIHKDLPNIMQLIDEKCTKKTPVHFMISKWDLLENRYFLAELKNRLLNKVPEFYNVVTNRKNAGCPVRLIPISAVGKGFTILDNGKMKKIPGKIPQPKYLEVGLAFALTDNRYNLIDYAKALDMSSVVSKTYSLINKVAKNKQNIQEFASNINAFKQVNAFEQVLETCKSIQQEFLTKFPESNL